MIIPIIEVIQTYLFVSCFLKRKVRFGKVLDWLVLIGVSEVGTIGNHYFQDANINILIAVIELFILLSFFDGGVKRKILAGLLYLVFAFLAEGVVAVGLSRAYDIRISDMGNQEEAVILLGKRYSREIRVIATMFFYLLSRKKRDTEKRDIQGQLLVIPALSAVLLVIVTEDQCVDGSDADPVYSDYQCSIICAFPQAGSLFQGRGNDPESVKRTGI